MAGVLRDFVTVTSQLFFCASPIRLDSYSRCQFGCVYCFARARTRSIRGTGVKEANPRAFGKRLERVAAGKTESALDEFLKARVPIQFGGMQDPFSEWEESKRTSLKLLEVLRHYDYPTIISTKGNVWLTHSYARVLRSTNCFVRISAAAIEESRRPNVDIGAGSYEAVLERIKRSRDLGIPIALRIQPVIPGSERVALDMAGRAGAAGAGQVSFEHLKVASENIVSESRRLFRATGRDVWGLMTAKGLTRVGKDYTLTAAAKVDFLRSARSLCRRLGVSFGAGDTEFIHQSDGVGCCNGSTWFLREAQQFTANFSGVLSQKRSGDLISFSDLRKEWSPGGNVHRYLTSNSRARDQSGRFSSWLSLLAHRWNGGIGPYSPAFFWGVRWTGKYDRQGFRIYRYEGLSEQETESTQR